MPPIPAPKTKEPKSSRRPSTGSGKREGTGGESSSARPSGTPRSRTTKADALKDEIARMYMMIGTMIRPFGRFYPVLGPVGDNFKDLSTDAADAWMQLAEKDARVMEMLKSITSASTYGNVIGIHLAIFASALPMGQMFTDSGNSDDLIADLWEQGKAAGMSDEEIQAAINQMQAPNMPARDTTAGGPGDTIRTGGAPVATAEPQTVPAAGIQTPADLGVTQPGEVGAFPADTTGPSGNGTVQV